ncbi:DUF2752 domain-containing protein [Paenibacillus sepulcri]|uniref:DUF2752 domain-containing protein n=2 Tax=Paenibacillus sepulcri TaxID=359917 RepID=A0ABS7BWH2_9BACL|nr:DUF2752 domain-containing protein [Paenibacillus sepulcri]
MLIKWHIGLNPTRYPKLAWGALLGAGGFIYLKIWLPATNLGVPCVFHELTGQYCPGCGITRSALSLLQLDFNQSFRYNPLIYFIMPLYAAYLVANKKQKPRISKTIMTVMLTVTVAFGIVRNIPLFDWLAPTEV